MSTPKDFDSIWIIFFKRELNNRKSTASSDKLLMIIEGHVCFTVTWHLKFSSVNFQVSHFTGHMLIFITHSLQFFLKIIIIFTYFN